MRHTAAIRVMALLLVAILASPAFAAVNFRKVDFSVVSDPTSGHYANLDCSFDVSGVGNPAIYGFCSVTTATAHYQCQNGGGNYPPPHTSTGMGLIGGAGPFTANKNGRASGEVFVAPPPPPANGDPDGCKDSWTVVLLDVTYTGLTLEIKDGPNYLTANTLAKFEAPSQSVSYP
jgi:hypothetical protein